MNRFMSRGAGSASGGKKLLLTIPFLFLAAACNKQQAVVQPMQNQQTQQQPQVTSTDETANWKIYRNDKFGFEVKYPSTWQYKEDKGSLISFCASDAKSCGLVSEGIAANIFISIEGNPKNLTAQQFLESKGMKITVGGVGESSKKKVDNHNAILLGPEGLAAAGSIFIENGNYIIELQGQSSGSEFDSMINSFKFTK